MNAQQSEKPFEPKVSMGKIMKHYSPKWLAACGMFVSVINGWSFPIYGLLFGNILFVMLVP